MSLTSFVFVVFIFCAFAQQPWQSIYAGASNIRRSDKSPVTGIEAASERILQNIHPKIIQGQPNERTLLQNRQGGGVGGECSLSQAQLTNYVDRDSGIWQIDDDVLQEINDDLQTIVDCAEEGDVIQFDVSGVVQPLRRITITRPITLTTATSSIELVDGVFPSTEQKTTFTCPDDNSGIFRIRSHGVRLANLQISGCSLGSDGASGIIAIGGCSSRGAGDGIQLHHVQVSGNQLEGSPAIIVNNPSCSPVEIIDLVFADNTCNGICGAILSKENLLREISIENNVRSEETGFAVISLPDSSNTIVNQLNATRNSGTVIMAVGASLSLSDSRFINNRNFSDVGLGGASGVIQLNESTAVIQGSSFSRNSGSLGAVFRINRSNLSLADSQFDNNDAADASVMFVEESQVEIDDCSFVGNSARINGSVGIFKSSSLRGTGNTFEKNSVEKSGGCFIFRSSQMRMARSTATFNRASFGSFARLEGESSGTLENCQFESNSAGISGGAVYLDRSSLIVVDCRFDNGTAEEGGGFLFIRMRSELNVSASIFTRGKASLGGCIESDNSTVVLESVRLSSGAARRTAGAVFLIFSSSGIFRNSEFSKNSAGELSGALCALEASEMVISNCSFVENTAPDGGALAALNQGSKIEIDSSQLISNDADYGGAILALDSLEVNIRDTVFQRNRAVIQGSAIRALNVNAINITRCTFRQSKGNPDAGGFLLIIFTSMTVTDSSFDDGKAESGGCLLFQEANVIIRNTTMTSCIAASQAGAILAVSSDLLLEDVHLQSGKASAKGALYSLQSTLTMRRGSLSNNTGQTTGAGIVADTGGQCQIQDVLFVGNEADFGSAFAIEKGTIGELFNCTFTENVASFGGGACYSESPELNINQCSFANNEAVSGGSIMAALRSSTKISDSTFTDSTAKNGGCILASRRARVQIQNVTFEGCNATRDGGAIYVEDSAFVKVSSSSLLGNEARRFGGAFASRKGKVTGNDLQFVSNTAAQGGAVYLDRSKGVEMIDVSFRDSFASKFGGVVRSIESTAKFMECEFSDSEAEIGGCIYATRSSVNIILSNFVRSVATESGGFVYVDRCSGNNSLRMENMNMTFGSAINGNGGAVASRSSDTKMVRTTISGCRSGADGGATFANDSSTLLCAGCTLSRNTAAGNGGAVSFQSPRSPGLVLQFDRTTMLHNKARSGGGLHLTDDRSIRNCLTATSSCSFAVIMGTVFRNNSALVAGGAIFASDLDVIRFTCKRDTVSLKTSFLAKEDWTTQKHVQRKEDICRGWRKNNAKRYGENLASSVHSIEKRIMDGSGRTSTMSAITDNYTVPNHRSGSSLPAIHFKFVDALNQGPAVGFKDEVVNATVSSRNGFFNGSFSFSLRDGEGDLPAMTGIQIPGLHVLTVEFSEAVLRPFFVEVVVRDCILGEVATANRSFCHACNGASYNIYPQSEEGCQPCPDNGDCTTHVIQPKKGYWNPTPCSTSIQQCLVHKACDFQNRTENIKRFTANITNCTLENEQINEYHKIQCNEGYKGVLCGSCTSSFGKTQTFNCAECFTRSGNVVMVLTSILMLLVLSAFTVRSNTLSSLLGGKTAAQAAAAVAASAAGTGQTTGSNPYPPSTSTAPDSIALELMQINQAPPSSNSTPVPNQPMDPNVLHGNQKPTATPAQQPARTVSTMLRDGELAKWKAVEQFKISINFLQVTAIALSINVDWHQTVETLFGAAEFVSGMTSQASHRSLECLFDIDARVPRSVSAEITMLAVPVGVFAMYTIFYLTVNRFVNKAKFIFQRRLFLSVTAICYISYISITKTLINILNCLSVTDSHPIVDGVLTNGKNSYWAVDTDLKCYEGSHAVLAALIAWPFLFIFTIAFPLGTAYLIVKNVQPDFKEGWIYATTGFMYRSYKSQYVYWESIIMLRKAVLATVVVFSYPLGGNLQGNLAVFVLAVALYFHLLCRPYREEFDQLNEIEALSLLVSLVTFVSSLFYNDDHVSNSVRILITVASTVQIIGEMFWIEKEFLTLHRRIVRFVSRLIEIFTRPRRSGRRARRRR